MTYDYLIVGAGLFGTTFAREMTDAGYDHGTLSHMANGGYQKQTRSKKGYVIRKKHKDIVKAEYIINDQEE